MLKQANLKRLEDYFSNLSSRPDKGVYFYRIASYNDQVKEFVRRYFEAARVSGVIIEGRIPNPTPQNLSYYNEMMGTAYQLDVSFIDRSLKKWLPRLQPEQRQVMANSIYTTLSGLKTQGKNDNMLKNAYIKFMCCLTVKEIWDNF